MVDGGRRFKQVDLSLYRAQSEADVRAEFEVESGPGDAILPTTRHDMVVTPPSTDRTKRLEVNGLAFEPPSGMVDLTTYAFQSADGRQSLEIEMVPSADAVPGGMEAAASVLADEVHRTLGVDSTIEAFGPLENGLQGWLVAYETDVRGMCDPQANPRERCGFGRLPDGRGVQLSERTLMGNDERFLRILASVRPLDSSASAPAEGLVRQSAGTVQLDAPEGLEPPRVLLFSMAADTTGSPGSGQGEISLAIAIEPKARERDRGLSAQARPPRPEPHGAEEVRTESVVTPSGMVLELTGRATGSMKSELTSHFERMIETLKTRPD